jgi:hypothetical protein
MKEKPSSNWAFLNSPDSFWYKNGTQQTELALSILIFFLFAGFPVIAAFAGYKSGPTMFRFLGFETKDTETLQISKLFGAWLCWFSFSVLTLTFMIA